MWRHLLDLGSSGLQAFATSHAFEVWVELFRGDRLLTCLHARRTSAVGELQRTRTNETRSETTLKINLERGYWHLLTRSRVRRLQWKPPSPSGARDPHVAPSDGQV
jgi:hypothetical protein